MLIKKFLTFPQPTIVGDAYVIFENGYNGVTYNTIKYSLPNGVTAAGGVLPVASSYTAAAGNAELGLFIAGSNRLAVKYRFSDDNVVTGTSLTLNFSIGGVAAGNAEMCLIARTAYTTPNQPGQPGQTIPTADVMRYTYAGDVVSAAVSLSAVVSNSASAGNKQFALFRLSATGPSTDRIEYASNVRTSGPALASYTGVFSGGSGTGNGVFGIIKGGRTNLGDPIMANKIHFASNTCIVGGSLRALANGVGSGMAGTINMAMFSNGAGNLGCVLYYYADDTSVYAAAAVQNVSGPGVCANPAGVNV